jgi:hypothetical protein
VFPRTPDIGTVLWSNGTLGKGTLFRYPPSWVPTEFAGRFISLNIKLASNDRAGKTIRGKQGHKQLALTLVWVYHPCTKTGEDKLYLQFLNTLDNLLGRAPANSEIVMGADVNSNIGKHNGIHSTEFCTVLGPHGLAKRNMKGESLLHIYLAHQLRVMNRSQVVQDIALG